MKTLYGVGIPRQAFVTEIIILITKYRFKCKLKQTF